jgi:hypothetical protein
VLGVLGAAGRGLPGRCASWALDLLGVLGVSVVSVVVGRCAASSCLAFHAGYGVYRLWLWITSRCLKVFRGEDLCGGVEDIFLKPPGEQE